MVGGRLEGRAPAELQTRFFSRPHGSGASGHLQPNPNTNRRLPIAAKRPSPKAAAMAGGSHRRMISAVWPGRSDRMRAETGARRQERKGEIVSGSSGCHERISSLMGSYCRGRRAGSSVVTRRRQFRQQSLAAAEASTTCAG